MKPINEMKLTFPSKSCNESFARVTLTGFISTLDPTAEQVADIKTAVSEAVTNSIVHGYREKMGNVYITAKIFENQMVRIVIRDNGCGIPDINKAMEPMYTSDNSGERAGLGFCVMQMFCDKVKVTSRPGKGTIITLEKQIVSRDEK